MSEAAVTVVFSVQSSSSEEEDENKRMTEDLLGRKSRRNGTHSLMKGWC